LPLKRTYVISRATSTGERHIPDILPLIDNEYPGRPPDPATVRSAMLVVPLMREGGVCGSS
jgi:hypothetical protein